MFSRWLKREMSQGRHLCLCSSRGPSCTPYTQYALVLGYHVNPLQKKEVFTLQNKQVFQKYQLKNEKGIGIYLGKPIGFPKIPLKTAGYLEVTGVWTEKNIRRRQVWVSRRGSKRFGGLLAEVLADCFRGVDSVSIHSFINHRSFANSRSLFPSGIFGWASGERLGSLKRKGKLPLHFWHQVVW